MRLKERSSHSFQPPSTIRSSPGNHVYTFSNGAAEPSSSSEDEFDVKAVRPRRVELLRQKASRGKVADVILLERDVMEDDNLIKLALQYGCTVADIKRFNNLIQEQDIYALKKIKIPVKVHGLLTEGHEELNLPQSSSGIECSLTILPSETLEATGSLPNNGHVSQYFHEVDQNIEAAEQTQELLNKPAGTSSLSNLSTLSLLQKEPSFGADWGIRWWNAVLIMLLVGVVLPVFYIIYYRREDVSHTSGSNLNLTVHSSGDNFTIGRTLIPSIDFPDAHQFMHKGG